MEKVFYKTDSNGDCLQLCKFKEEDVEIYVGSLLCKQCNQNLSYEPEEQWIKCEIYSSIQEVAKLKKENEQLRKEIGSLVDKILEMKGENNGKES